MLRLAVVFVLSLPLTQAWPQASDLTKVGQIEFSRISTEESELPDAPSAVRSQATSNDPPIVAPIKLDSSFTPAKVDAKELAISDYAGQSRKRPDAERPEPYHWKGLLLQSFAFSGLENGVRIMTADQHDRHLLLNKPFWTDYWASLGQFNMRRWNDGDSFPVNYVGHPMQGAISGYIEVQNDPRGRELQISRSPAYWKSVFKAFLWATVYSTQSEIGPMGEAAIFNEGGFTYPQNCQGSNNNPECWANAKYTNNTGWVDFIITPTVGTLWLIGEDTMDRYISNPLVRAHPRTFGYKVLRAGLNPSRSLANILRGHYPWFRDFEHPGMYESAVVQEFERAMDREPVEHVDMFFHYASLNLNVHTDSCSGCRSVATGWGMGYGFAVRRYLDIVVDTSLLPEASPGSALNIGGSLWTANFGLRSGYSGEHFALKLSIAPGFATYSRTQAAPNSPYGRTFNFSLLGALSADLRFTRHLAFRSSLQQMVIRYKSTERDPEGIGTPPWLSFMSHDNYINSTNWGVTLGPVLRF
jgi:hypothetical protein